MHRPMLYSIHNPILVALVICNKQYVLENVDYPVYAMIECIGPYFRDLSYRTCRTPFAGGYQKI